VGHVQTILSVLGSSLAAATRLAQLNHPKNHTKYVVVSGGESLYRVVEKTADADMKLLVSFWSLACRRALSAGRYF
jgi:hypothetical protein